MQGCTPLKNFDVIVIGVGAMGSSTCYHLAKKGVRVLGLEQFSVGHDRGSSHGETRMIRKAYFEHPAYVPLLKRAYQLWDELCAETKQQLFHRVGLVLYGKKNESEILSGVRRSAADHHLAIEELNRSQALRRFPGFTPPQGFEAVYERDAGYLEVENCVRAMAQQAKIAGAQILENEKVLSWSGSENEIEIQTAREKYISKKVIFCAGAWTQTLLKELGVGITIHRNMLYWFETQDAWYAKPGTPCFGIEIGNKFFYGFPASLPWGLKIADHSPGQILKHPEDLSLSPVPEPDSTLKDCITNFLPGVTQNLNKAKGCIYSMSPDGHFIVDQHPEYSNIWLAGGFSGHGFKFATVMGEVLSDLSMDGKTSFDIKFLGLNRLLNRPS